MEDTIDPRGHASCASGSYGRRTAVFAVPALVAVGLAAGALAGGPAHALTPQPPHSTASPQQHGKQPVRPAHPPEPSHTPTPSAQPSHEGGQRSRDTQGGHRSPGADVRLVYDRPEAATGESGVIWHWTVVNEGSTRADDVVATQKITSGHKILGLSKPCASDHETVVCRFDTIGAGEKRTGWIKTSGSVKGGPLHVDAKMTWREPRPGARAVQGGRHPGH